MNDQMLLELVRQVDPLTTAVGEPPHALLERVLASPRTGRGPRRVKRWHARIGLVAAVVGVSGAIAALAIAGTGWLTGTPAPPQVVTDFHAYTPRLGFHPDPDRAVLVAEDGQVRLYATTDHEGTYCLDLVAPWKPATTLDGGTCVPKPIAAGHFVAGNLGAGPVTKEGTTLVVAGRIADPTARSVRFAGPDGQTVTRSVGSSGFFVAALTTSGPCANGDWGSSFTAFDAKGNPVAHTPVLVLQKLSEKRSAARGVVRACWGSFLQK